MTRIWCAGPAPVRPSPAGPSRTLVDCSPARFASPDSSRSDGSAQTNPAREGSRRESNGDIAARLLCDGDVPNRRSTRDAVPVCCASHLLCEDADDFFEEEHSPVLGEAGGVAAHVTAAPAGADAPYLAPEELKGAAKSVGDGAGPGGDSGGEANGEGDLWLDSVGVLGLADDCDDLPLCDAPAVEHAVLAWMF